MSSFWPLNDNSKCYLEARGTRWLLTDGLITLLTMGNGGNPYSYKPSYEYLLRPMSLHVWDVPFFTSRDLGHWKGWETLKGREVLLGCRVALVSPVSIPTGRHDKP